MTMSAYVNVHGEPIGISASDAVRAIEPGAVCEAEIFVEGYAVRRTAHKYARIIGTGANEEAAWRDAWSRMLAEDVVKEGRA